MKLERIYETCLYAGDLRAAEGFYHGVLGLEVAWRGDRLVAFCCGGAVLLVFDPARAREAGGDAPPHGARGPGHVAFGVPEEELERWARCLRAAGVEVEKEVAWDGGGRSLYLRDPAGNSVELATPDLWNCPAG